MCTSSANLSDHARGVCQKLGLGDEKRADVEDRLRELAADGLLISGDEVFGCRVSAPHSRRNSVHIASIVIPTHDQPDMALRAVVSYLSDNANHRRDIPLVVADDSASAAVRDTYRRGLRLASANGTAPVLYAGLEEKKWFADLLVEQHHLPREVVEFGLLGDPGHTCSIGANRNSLLLHTVGDAVLSVDDDTVCRVGIVPGHASANHIEFSSENDPTEFWFFETREAALRASDASTEDVLAAHEEFLGRRIAEIARENAQANTVSINQACPHLLEGLITGSGSVVATYHGVLGDSGMYSGSPIFFNRQQATRERFLCSQHAYDSALASREVIRVVPRVTLTHGGPWMGFASGLDNRVLLPPFLPVARHEDGVFGVTLRKCYRDKCFAHLPRTLLHSPLARRSYSPGFVQSASGVRISDIIMWCIQNSPSLPGKATAKASLEFLGSYLVEIGSLNREDFQELVRMLMWTRAGYLIRELERILKENNAQPEFWANDIQSFIEALRKAVVSVNYGIPEDLVQERSPYEAWSFAQNLVRKFGALMQCWPAIVEAAAALRAKGERLALEVRA